MITRANIHDVRRGEGDFYMIGEGLQPVPIALQSPPVQDRYLCYIYPDGREASISLKNVLCETVNRVWKLGIKRP